MSADPMEVRLDTLLGRRVRATNGRVIGRIEEIRAERHGADYEVTEVLIGPGALIERLALVNWTFGRRPSMYAARWDQITLDSAEDSYLTVAIRDLNTR